MQKKTARTLNTTENFTEYFRVVVGSERSRHNYQKRLSTIREFAVGFNEKRVLDVGCGYGFRTIGLTDQVQSAVGIDIDFENIVFAISHVNRQGIKNIRFCCADGYRLPFKDEIFDLVLGDEMIHHIENPLAVIKEMYRVTKKGGIVIISDHNKLSLFSQIVRYLQFGKKRKKLYSAKQIAWILGNAGLRNIKLRHIIFTLPFHNIPKPILKINYIFESLIEAIPGICSQCGVYVVRGIK